MKLPFPQVFFCVILVAVGAHAEPQSAAPKHVTVIGHLSCGGVTLKAETVYLDVPDRDFQPLSQRITQQRASQSPTVLHHDGRPLHQPFLQGTAVLDAAVSGWACLKSTDGKAYIYVLYICTESDLRPQCAGTSREWGRLFDPQGKELTAGFLHDGPRESALMKRLGLGRYEDEPMPMRSIDDSANPP